jgi:hypothetical protein
MASSFEKFDEVTLEVLKTYLLARVAPQLNDIGRERLQIIGEIEYAVNPMMFAEYGCALIFSNASFGISRFPQVAITMIALDTWTFFCAHRKFSNYVMTSFCNEYSSLPVGTINSHQVKETLEKFETLLRTASQKHGHQRTPGFILSILQQALAIDTSQPLPPLPGFTDVGEHSGQIPRRITKWSLVKSITKHILLTNLNQLDQQVTSATQKLCLLIFFRFVLLILRILFSRNVSQYFILIKLRISSNQSGS